LKSGRNVQHPASKKLTIEKDLDIVRLGGQFADHGGFLWQ
jgi:hypothetical protein